MDSPLEEDGFELPVPEGFVTLPGNGKEGARAEFRSRLGGRSLPRHCFGSELSQG